jgi:hypothetical protein
MSDQSDHQDSVELRLHSIETRLDRGNTRLDALDEGQDRSNSRLDALDRGQAAMIRRMDSDELERGALRAEIRKNTEATEATLAQTKSIRELTENMQTAGHFFNQIYGFFAMLGRGLHAVAKALWPIVALGVLIWGAVYAWISGGKPPSVG